MNNQNKLWLEIPTYVFVALARRGMEKISLDQCFLPGCDNDNRELLEPIGKEEYEEKKHHIKLIYMKCYKCKRKFQLKLDTIKHLVEQKKKDFISMGLVYALDENGKNLGHIGYF
ncbi:MAG: hypothetical protein KGD57_04685 [Candidatus Lokiarchaeota archaeon]|nr:hypothetical protein [Candidatus Lokiarchaeota archaeon]